MEDETESSDTKSTSTRWQYTNDVLAGVLVLFAVFATAAYIYRSASVPMWLYLTDAVAIVTAVVWAFGGGAFEKAAGFVGGGK